MPKNIGHIKILSPAKINLFLCVTGKRTDGYHELVTLMCCIKLYDTIRLQTGERVTTVSCDHPEVPEDDKNIAWQAADLFMTRLKRQREVSNGGVRISIEKKIPVAAGLGGGSSNAAAVFLGLNRIYDHPFAKDEIFEMGVSIGADVPFLIQKKPAIATGIGDKLKAYNGLRPLKILLVCPGFGVSTTMVYKNMNLGLTKCAKKLKQFHSDRLDFDIKKHLCNDLEPVTGGLYPDIFAVKESLLNEGAIGVLMSGSGPTVFGVFSNSDELQRAKKALSIKHPWQLISTDLII